MHGAVLSRRSIRSSLSCFPHNLILGLPILQSIRARLQADPFSDVAPSSTSDWSTSTARTSRRSRTAQHFALCTLALDPECDWLFPGRRSGALLVWTIALTEYYWEAGTVPVGVLSLLFFSIILVVGLVGALGVLVGYQRAGAYV